jgi:hypothetical protein
MRIDDFVRLFAQDQDSTIELPSWPRPVQTSAMIRILADVISLDATTAVVVFGSAVRPLQHLTVESNRFLGLFRKTTRMPQWAHDVDITVVAKTDRRIHRTFHEEYSTRCSDGYGTWLEKRVLRNAFDVSVTDAMSFQNALHDREETAISIVRDGIVLAGEWPDGPSRKFVQRLAGKFEVDIGGSTVCPATGD